MERRELKILNGPPSFRCIRHISLEGHIEVSCLKKTVPLPLPKANNLKAFPSFPPGGFHRSRSPATGNRAGFPGQTEIEFLRNNVSVAGQARSTLPPAGKKTCIGSIPRLNRSPGCSADVSFLGFGFKFGETNVVDEILWELQFHPDFQFCEITILFQS